MTLRRVARVGLIALVAVALWWVFIASVSMTSGGPAYVWDEAYRVVRHVVRAFWAGITGQPMTTDLFPG